MLFLGDSCLGAPPFVGHYFTCDKPVVVVASPHCVSALELPPGLEGSSWPKWGPKVCRSGRSQAGCLEKSFDCPAILRIWLRMAFKAWASLTAQAACSWPEAPEREQPQASSNLIMPWIRSCLLMMPLGNSFKSACSPCLTGWTASFWMPAPWRPHTLWFFLNSRWWASLKPELIAKYILSAALGPARTVVDLLLKAMLTPPAPPTGTWKVCDFEPWGLQEHKHHHSTRIPDTLMQLMLLPRSTTSQESVSFGCKVGLLSAQPFCLGLLAAPKV